MMYQQQITRREFLSATTATAGGALISPSGIFAAAADNDPSKLPSTDHLQ